MIELVGFNRPAERGYTLRLKGHILRLLPSSFSQRRTRPTMLSYQKRSTKGQHTSQSGETTPATSDHIPISTSTASSAITANDAQPKTEHHHIWLITGPA